MALESCPPRTKARYHGKSASGFTGSGKRGDLSSVEVSWLINSFAISVILLVVKPSLVASITYSLPFMLYTTCSPSLRILLPSALSLPTKLPFKDMEDFEYSPNKTSELPKLGLNSLPAKREVPRCEELTLFRASSNNSLTSCP